MQRPVRLVIAILCGVVASFVARQLNGGQYLFGVAAVVTFGVSFGLRAAFPEKR
jgi:hypothetical protein